MPKSRGRKSKPGQAERDRAARLRREERDLFAEAQVAMQFGAVSDFGDAEQLDQVRQVTHDRVIAATAGHRASGVTWHHVPATDMPGCLALLGDAATLTAEQIVNRAGLIEFLEANPEGGLVVATCRWLRSQDRRKANLS